MNKDALLATCIGFGVGLIITGLVFMGPSMIKKFPSFQFPSIQLGSLTKKNTRPNASPTKAPSTSSTLTIESPLADSIEPDSDMLVSGHTNAGATVVIENGEGENVVIANSQGAYAGTIKLNEGKNDIYVTSYAKQTQKQTVTVYFTPENF